MHDVEHDHAGIGRDVVLLQLAPARVAAEDVQLDGSLPAQRAHVATATFWLGFSSPSTARSSDGGSGSGAVRSSIAPARSRVTTFFFPHSGSGFGKSSRGWP